MYRFLPLLALALFAATATAQPGYYDQPVYNGLDDSYDDASPGVRVGFGVGPYIYSGPQFDAQGFVLRDDALATNLGVTAEISFPLAGQLYGRVMGGLLNIGADADDDVFENTNPFLTSETILAEADLMYYLARPGAGQFAPYVFSGLSGLFATGDGDNGTETTALAIPVGIGFEYGVNRNLALYAEGSYRFGLTEINSGSTLGNAVALAVAYGDDVCDGASSSYNRDVCIKKGREPFCENGGNPDDGCRQVIGGGDRNDGERFNSGLITAGLRLGFGGAPGPRIPEYREPVRPFEPVIEIPVAPQAPQVCDLVELNSVYFDYGTGSLDRRGRSLLDENVDLLLSNTACCVFIDGYTDTSEGDRFGMSLAGRRAQAVYDYYLSRGVSASRLQIRNRGVAVPACDKEDPGPGCERNRRVESLPVDCERFQFLLENPSYDRY